MRASLKTYCVWNNLTDQIVALDETATKCADLMGITRNAFYGYISGKPNRSWTIIESKQIESEEVKYMNKLTIIGNLTKDPELRTTQSGINVCSFTVAVNRRQKKDQQPEADFFRVSAFNERAVVCSKFLAKGKKVCVIGPVTVRTWQTQDGETRASLEVTADEIEFLSPRDGFTPVEDPDNPFS